MMSELNDRYRELTREQLRIRLELDQLLKQKQQEIVKILMQDRSWLQQTEYRFRPWFSDDLDDIVFRLDLVDIPDAIPNDAFEVELYEGLRLIRLHDDCYLTTESSSVFCDLIVSHGLKIRYDAHILELANVFQTVGDHSA